MKRLLLACFLLTATCTIISVPQHATAQTTPVTQTSFMVKVNAMDAFVGAGNMAAAQAKWDEIHTDMIQVLGVTKASIHNAATPADVTTYTNIFTAQRALYTPIWDMHTDLITNRITLKDQLTQFSATIY